MSEEDNLESAATWLQANNIKPLMEYLCAMCVLNRPTDPHAFISALLRTKVKARGGEEYDAAINTDLVRGCYSLAAESADENGRVRGSAAFKADNSDEDDYDDIDFGPGQGGGGKSALSGDVAKRVGNLEKVLSSSRRVGGSMNVAGVAKSIIEETQSMLSCAKAELYIVNSKAQTIGKCDQETGMIGNQIPTGKCGIPGTVSQKGRVLNVPDAYQHADFNASEDESSGFKTTSLMAIPIPDPKGRPVAVVVALNAMGKSRFDRSDEEMMVVFAGQMGMSLSNAMVNEASSNSTRSQNSMLLVLNDMFMHHLDDERNIVTYMMENGMNIVDCDKCLFYLMDDNSGQLWSISENEIQYFPTNAGILGYVATKVETINISDTSQDPRFDKSHDIKSGYTTNTVLAMPIVDATGSVVAVIQFLNKLEGGVFSKTDEDTVTQMSGLIGPVLAALRSKGSNKK